MRDYLSIYHIHVLINKTSNVKAEYFQISFKDLTILSELDQFLVQINKLGLTFANFRRSGKIPSSSDE